MSRAYDTRPDLEGYEALTVRGIAKFVAVLALLFGGEFLADRLGVGRWFHVALQLAWIALGVRILWDAGKALISGKLPAAAEAPPRYSDRAIRIVSPRADAVFQLVCGILIVLVAIERIILISQGGS